MVLVVGLRTQPGDAAPLPAHSFSVAPAALPPLAERLPTGVAANRLVIPSLGIAAPLVPERIEADALTIPGDVHDVGRSTDQQPVDATRGTTLLAGHVHYTGQGNGALAPLHRVRPGVLVVVTDAHARERLWRVVAVGSYPKAEHRLPAYLFTRTGPRRLVVVTCGGAVQPGVGYPDNVVVTAVPYVAG